MSSVWSNAATVGPGVHSGVTAVSMGQGYPLSGLATSKASNATAAVDSTGSDDSSSSSDGDTSISANDFLTLLVTEMQNQDPTADTDPNEYINQLTEINSLEQLISINQNLQTALGGTTTSSGSSTDTAATAAKSAAQQIASTGASPSQQVNTASLSSRPGGHPVRAGTAAAGNLNSPRLNEAATRVGHALSGQTRRAAGPAIRDIPTRALP